MWVAATHRGSCPLFMGGGRLTGDASGLLSPLAQSEALTVLCQGLYCGLNTRLSSRTRWIDPPFPGEGEGP